MHKNFANTVDLLTLAMQTILPCEAHARVRAVDELENKTKPAQTFSDATAALREWSYVPIEGISGDVWDEPRDLWATAVRVFSVESSHDLHAGFLHRVGHAVPNDAD